MILAAESPIASLTWIEIALVIFIMVFVAVTIAVLSAKRGAFHHAARIPLDDDWTAPEPPINAKGYSSNGHVARR